MAALRFGVATADHQCEAYDGRDDVRDVWERVRGIVPRGKATDFWNRYREDVQLARGLGCTVFRLSLSWARLEPQPGAWDDAAFAHYRDVLQAIRDAGMSAIVTLVHNSWPLHVQAAGRGAGPLDTAFPQRVASYATEVARRLGDLIDDYVTLNEPNQLVYGWIKGFWMRSYAMPPGQPPYQSADEQMDDVLTLIPNLFRAHANARSAIRALRPNARVGTNPLVLGLPQWLQRWIDRNATHLRSPQDAKRQAARIAQAAIAEGGRVDCSIAQLTLTQQREQHAFFSEPYYCTHLAALHLAAPAMPVETLTWRASVGVVSQTLTADIVAGWFPAATIRYFDTMDDAVAALRQGALEAVFDDEALLRAYVNDGVTLTRLPGSEQYFAIAMSLGNRTLLNMTDRAIRDLRKRRSDIPDALNRKTIADVGEDDGDANFAKARVPDMDRSIERIRKRGVLRVGVHPGVPGLCDAIASAPKPSERYSGLEPELARAIAERIFGDPDRVEFVPVAGARRIRATRSWLHALNGIRKSFAIFGTLLGTNWWNLGMAGKLPAFLCPPECVGTLDFVGLDYYWGIPSFWPSQLHRLSAAADFQYSDAPVWPSALDTILAEATREFPGKPIIVVENGCVAKAAGFSRADYVKAHVEQVRRSVEHGAPVDAYICWSITSNREWGLPFDDGSDFGLYHIDLDTDPDLKRVPTDSSRAYAELIAGSSSEEAP
jgi:beta-glucosidase/6-phospho-beta-glucosidase/beta-galactosidase/ABC-type amino acid transport substrate-binding protein